MQKAIIRDPSRQFLCLIVSCYLLSSCTMEVSLWPLMTICCSLSCLATWDTHQHTHHYNLIKSKGLHCFNALKTNSTTLTSLAEDPETSIQVLEKKAQDPSMKTM